MVLPLNVPLFVQSVVKEKKKVWDIVCLLLKNISEVIKCTLSITSKSWLS